MHIFKFYLVHIITLLVYYFINLGTGSGSLSHALIRVIRPHGYLYTFDFHEQRVNIAQAEFERHGLSKFVSSSCKDVCIEGFGKELDTKADAIFLDLPHPWLAIDYAVSTLKKSGTNYLT